jgi:hypothetical protein
LGIFIPKDLGQQAFLFGPDECFGLSDCSDVAHVRMPIVSLG